MSILRNPEYRGVLILVLVIMVVGLVLAATTGKLEQWFGLRLFAGPRALDRIIYVSDSSGSPEVWVMKRDGKDARQLTTGAKVRSAPAISAQGDRIVYVGRFANSNQVFSIGAKGGKPDRLTSATGPKKDPRYTPDGKMLSFISSGVVYLSDPGGEHPDPILPTHHETRARMSDPVKRGEAPAYIDYAWGPDSSAIVGISRSRAGNDTVVYLPDHEAQPRFIGGPALPWATLLNKMVKREGGSGPHVADDDPVRVAGVSWAADPPAFALSVVSGDDGFLIVFGIDEGKLGIGGFKSFAGHKIGPAAFAPDGSAVVVATEGDAKSGPGLVRVDLAGGSAHIIASGTFSRPSYSPDGKRLLATLTTPFPPSLRRGDEGGSSRNIVSIDLASGKANQLTRDGVSHDAVWTPSSQK